jgi:HAE1 family hydrophobic/amphiphilic exporter-1
MRCSQLLETADRKTAFGRAFEQGFERAKESYRKILGWALDRKKKVLIGSAVFFAASLFLLPLLRREFVPLQDQSMFLARLQTPLGSSIEFTNQRFREVEAVVAKRPEVRRYLVSVGGFGGGGRANEGVLFISLKAPRDRPRDAEARKRLSQQEVMSRFRQEFQKVPDVKAVFQDLSTRGFAAHRGFPIEFTVRGPNWDTLSEYSRKIREEMEKSNFFQDVDTDYLQGMPEVRVWPDRDKAQGHGVSVQALARTINSLIAGEQSGRARTFEERGAHRNPAESSVHHPARPGAGDRDLRQRGRGPVPGARP